MSGLSRLFAALPPDCPLPAVHSLFLGFFSFGLSLFRGLFGGVEVLVPGILSRFIHQ